MSDQFPFILAVLCLAPLLWLLARKADLRRQERRNAAKRRHDTMQAAHDRRICRELEKQFQ